MQAFFYLPESYLPTPEARQAWENGTVTQLEQAGKIACAQCWIYQTWLNLRQAGAEVELVHAMPKEGLIVTLSNCLNRNFRAGPEQFVVAVVADFLPHPGACWQVLQNRAHARSLARSSFLPLWPQPNITPRDPERGERFETLAFFGDPCNLAPDLRSRRWQERLEAATGVKLEIRLAARWSDFSDVDCAIGVRDFSGKSHPHKPATKLYNAWIAGVPFLGGSDSAFAAERKSPLDYLRVDRPEAVIEAVKTLRTDRTLREAMRDQAGKRAAEYTPAAITQKWQKFLFEDLRDEIEAWRQRSDLSRSFFFLGQQARFFFDRKFGR